MNQPTPRIEVFDRARLVRNLRRAAPRLENHNFLFEWAEQELAHRLCDVARAFDTAIRIGTRSSGKALKSTGRIGHLYDIDLAGPQADLIADEEYLPFADASLDLVTSALNLHSVNDLPGCLLQIRRALKPDGLFMAAMLGGETLYELRESLTQAELQTRGGASPRVFPFADKQQMGALLQRAGFNLPVVDSEIITVTYDTMFKLLHDLRFMGEGNIIRERSRANPGKALFMEAARHYAENHSEQDGRIRATFEIIFLCGWSPHESQQKPLRPGSAKTRLADALDVQEIKTGEKAAP